jgi:integral membrane protein
MSSERSSVTASDPIGWDELDATRHNHRVPNALRTLRYVAIAEATTFLALLVATAVKYSDGGETGVQVLGPIHGALFLAYVILTLSVRGETGWSTRTTVWLLVAAVLPFGGYAADRWLGRWASEARQAA